MKRTFLCDHFYRRKIGFECSRPASVFNSDTCGSSSSSLEHITDSRRQQIILRPVYNNNTLLMSNFYNKKVPPGSLQVAMKHRHTELRDAGVTIHLKLLVMAKWKWDNRIYWFYRLAHEGAACWYSGASQFDLSVGCNSNDPDCNRL